MAEAWLTYAELAEALSITPEAAQLIPFRIDLQLATANFRSWQRSALAWTHRMVPP